jgi:hypothetical protein
MSSLRLAAAELVPVYRETYLIQKGPFITLPKPEQQGRLKQLLPLLHPRSLFEWAANVTVARRA